jgi:hypothetical protein
MESARGEAFLSKGFQRAMQDIGLVPRRSDRLSHERDEIYRTSQNQLILCLELTPCVGQLMAMVVAIPSWPHLWRSQGKSGSKRYRCSPIFRSLQLRGTAFIAPEANISFSRSSLHG